MVKASPLAKRIARERGIDLTHISGSGPDDRIVKRDLEKVQTADIQSRYCSQQSRRMHSLPKVKRKG